MSVMWCDVPHSVRNFHRLGAAIDAFLLKITIEERRGYPVELVSDGSNPNVRLNSNLTGGESVYSALASGEVDLYPEVHEAEPAAVCCSSLCIALRAAMVEGSSDCAGGSNGPY